LAPAALLPAADTEFSALPGGGKPGDDVGLQLSQGELEPKSGGVAAQPGAAAGGGAATTAAVIPTRGTGTNTEVVVWLSLLSLRTLLLDGYAGWRLS